MSRRRVVANLRPEEEQAERLGITLRTLRSWRAKGYGPTPTYVGRFVFYTPQAEIDFLTASQKPFPQRGRAA